MKTMNESIKELKRRLEIPETFLTDIYNESDWSFIIKLNALFEAASHQLLVNIIGIDELKSPIGFLDYANNKYGKIRMLKDCGAIYNHQYSFLRELAEIRNDLVHNINRININLVDYFNLIADEKKRQLIKTLKNFVIESEDQEQFICENLKFILYHVSNEIFACLNLGFDRIKLKNEESILNILKAYSLNPKLL